MLLAAEARGERSVRGGGSFVLNFSLTAFTPWLSFSTNILGLCDSYKTLMWKMKALCEYCSLTETRRVHDKRPVDRWLWRTLITSCGNRCLMTVAQIDRLFISKVLNYDSEPNILLYLKHNISYLQ